MTSVERLVSLGNVPVESTLYEEEEKQRPIVVGRSRDDDVEDTYSSADSLIDWPRTGAIELRDLEYRYRIDAPLVLRGISCSFGAGSKNGLVGRTGSGKSSTMAAISRLHDVCGGCVVIDGVDVSKIPLSRLRSAIAVIPQSPSLFSGTVQFNVDPFGERTSREVLASLKEAHLLSKFSDKANLLQTQVEEGGANWSTGERQLICLARALLLRRRIVVVDEATANVDFDTDAHIQKTLRKSEAFESATLLMIAHRISTILDSDQVVVLEHGTIIESGSPDKLLSQPQSHFSAMVAASEKQGSTPL